MNRFFLVTFLIIFMSCSSSNFFFSAKYGKNNIRNSEIGIITDISKYLVNDDFDYYIEKKLTTFGPLSEREKGYFEDHFPRIFRENSYLFITSDTSKPDNIVLKKRLLKNSNNDYFIPNSKISFKGKYPKFLLIFQDISFKINNEIVGSGLGRTGSPTFTLSGKYNYVILNNDNQEIIAYGIIENSIRTFAPPKQNDYLVILEDSAKKLLQNSPFMVRYNVY